MEQLSPETAAGLREALALAQRGSLAGARARAEALLGGTEGHGAIHAFLGMLCCQLGDIDSGIDHLRRALAQSPQDGIIAANLATALVQAGHFEEAAAVATRERAANDPSLRLMRLRAYAFQQLERYVDAADAYRNVVEHLAGDWESWNNLGNALSAMGEIEGAIEAQTRALALAPDAAPIRFNLAASYSQAGRLQESERELRKLADSTPGDPKPFVELGRLLVRLGRSDEARECFERAVLLEPPASQIWLEVGELRLENFDLAGAEEAFRAAVDADRKNADAWIRVALLLDTTNQDEAFAPLIEAAEREPIDANSLDFIKALFARRMKDHARGLRLLDSIPKDVKPIVQEQLRGQFLDGLGDVDGAFAAFSEMNRLFRDDPSNPVERGRLYRDELRKDDERVGFAWFSNWQDLPPPEDGRKSPVFLVGFPRSGTTLLDTMLMGHEGVEVMEEKPPLRKVELQIGGLDALAGMTIEQRDGFRTAYFDEAARWAELRSDSLLVDKSPLHMNKVPLIRRLFPDARFILALRHPCDCVLSCFITPFRLNNAMASFVDLDTSAEFYDLSFSHWKHCTDVIPVPVHTVRYEDIVADAEGQLRVLLKFLDLEWSDNVLNHERTARSRGLISTASYAQVTEGLYTRAKGRWEKYRTHMAPVLPVLKPWAESFEYEV